MSETNTKNEEGTHRSGVASTPLLEDKPTPYMIVEVGMKIPLDMEGRITKRGIARKEVELRYANWHTAKTYGL